MNKKVGETKKNKGKNKTGRGKQVSTVTTGKNTQLLIALLNFMDLTSAV